jgi:hypothetical protein
MEGTRLRFCGGPGKKVVKNNLKDNVAKEENVRT